MLKQNLSSVKSIQGMTLIELMVVVVIVGILAAFAYPAYTGSVQKTRRSEAHAALSSAASQQEQFFLNNKSYTVSFGTTGINMPTVTEGGFYNLSAVAPTAACPISRCYVLQAVPPAGGVQASDPCGTLTYNSNEVKTPANCW